MNQKGEYTSVPTVQVKVIQSQEVTHNTEVVGFWM